MKKRLRDLLLSLPPLFLGLLVVFPIFYGILGAFKAPHEFAAYPPGVLPASFAYTRNFSDVFALLPVFRFFLNSFCVALLGAFIRMLLAALAAYAFAFFTFPGKKALFFLLLGTMMLPADTLLITNYQSVSRLGLLDSYLGMAIVSFVGASQMFMLRQQFLSSPRPMREAAFLDGCGDLRFMLSILLPTCRPILVTLFAQSFVNLWNTYLWPLLVTNRPDMRTIQVGITMLTTSDGTNYHLILAGVALSLIPAFILFLFLRKAITRSSTEGALVG